MIFLQDEVTSEEALRRKLCGVGDEGSISGREASSVDAGTSTRRKVGNGGITTRGMTLNGSRIFHTGNRCRLQE